MSVLSIRMIGDPVLRTPSAPVDLEGGAPEPRITKLIADMYETMDEVRGIGLAAPQVGVGLRIFTYSVDGVRGAVINPQLELSGETSFTPRRVEDGPAEGENLLREGCLSIKEIYGPVARPQRARLTGTNEHGEPVDVEATGLLAACFQHEVDHLDGKLFIDRLTGDDKKTAYRALRAQEAAR
ncbi:peptide deformylase [Nesterenkonia flava]|uniref:Peptide deformylase n=1 Tax=Nesterenkonia flava TaxID=469799 RepID=A0ABU1FV73_9MICC|nr:peptide deformylase [Nesterenkonia flava]MDR5712561.1 peptide deformylase [Nesterenkonia flava]